MVPRLHFKLDLRFLLRQCQGTLPIGFLGHHVGFKLRLFLADLHL